MFPKENENNKHTEEDHTAVGHKCEEFSYRTILAVIYVQHSYTLDVGKHFKRS